VIISAEPGPQSGPGGVFDLAFLGKLRALHEAIEERIPYVDEVTSLVNARDIRGEEDTLLVEDFLDPWPGDEDRLAILRKRALANPLFRNNVISADATVTTIVLDLQLYTSIGSSDDALAGFGPFEEGEAESNETPPLLNSAEEAEFVRALHEIVAEFEGPEADVLLAPALLALFDPDVKRR
jgi:hypothetical protein